MKLLLFLFLSDEDWRKLEPSEASLLGRRRNLSSEEKEKLRLFQASDLRTTWACRRIVLMWNAGVVLGTMVVLQFFGLTIPQIVKIARDFIFAP